MNPCPADSASQSLQLSEARAMNWDKKVVCGAIATSDWSTTLPASGKQVVPLRIRITVRYAITAYLLSVLVAMHVMCGNTIA